MAEETLTTFLSRFSLNEQHFNDSSGDVSLNGKPVFFWLNATLHENFSKYEKNTTYLRKLAEKHDSIMALMYEMVISLERILDKIDTRNMTTWVIPLNKHTSNEFTVQQNVNFINLSKNICTSHKNQQLVGQLDTLFDVLPITKNKNANIIGSLLNICPISTYYPTDTEHFPVQRALLYNLMLAENIDMENNDIEIVRQVKEFIQKLPRETDIKLFETIYKNILRSNHNTNMLWNALFSAYQRITNVIPSRYYEYMKHFDDSIPDFLIKLTKDNTKNKTSNYKEDVKCEPVKYCSDGSINEDKIVKIFENYETFYKNGSTDVKTLELCPVEVSYVLHLFPFYKYKWLKITNDNTVTVEDIDMDKTSNKKSMKNFHKIKQLVSFNGNYEKFKSTLQLISTSYADVNGYIDALYENRGFKCSVIICELLNYHFNTTFHTMQMYNLISRLSFSNQTLIDKQNTCQLEHKSIETKIVIENILTNCRVFERLLDHSSIEATLNKMAQYMTQDNKLTVASFTNYNCIPLIQHYRMYPEHRDDIIQLLMFSSAPANLKRLLYDMLPPTLTTYPNIKNEVALPIDKSYPNNVAADNVDSNLYSDCLVLLDQFKNTKDPDTLAFITNKLKNNETTEAVPS